MQNTMVVEREGDGCWEKKLKHEGAGGFQNNGKRKWKREKLHKKGVKCLIIAPFWVKWNEV